MTAWTVSWWTTRAQRPPVARKRDGDAVFVALGHAPDARRADGQVGDVGDGERRGRGVDDERDALAHVVAEERGGLGVGLLGGLGRERGERLAAGRAARALVEVDVDVVGLHAAPLGRLVADAVLPEREVLRARGHGSDEGEQEEGGAHVGG